MIFCGYLWMRQMKFRCISYVERGIIVSLKKYSKVLYILKHIGQIMSLLCKSACPTSLLPRDIAMHNALVYEIWNYACISFRDSHPDVFCEKSVLRNFTNFTGEYLCSSLFFNEKQTLAQVFSCEYCEVSENTFLHRTPLVAVSIVYFE